MSELRRILKRQFGFNDFRAHQKRIVEAFVAGRDVFAALPTGGGKSLCYQLPAIAGGGLTLVVSPLIALMKDQVDAARANGLAAACLNSTLGEEEARETYRDLAAGRVSLLYVSPERLALGSFRDALAAFGVTRIAIDEAHCISEWGHEFRPDYRALGSLRALFPSVPIAAFTATATRSVQDDVIAQLSLQKPLVVRASFDRSEIFYRVERKRSVGNQIVGFVERHRGEPGIVYRSTRRATEETAALLRQRGIDAAAYHAGLSQEERRERQEQFVHDKVPVIVATIAFGMGIDKSNVRWIVHGDLPKSLESYYQETGRAARDGEPAETALFYGANDIATIRHHISRMEDDSERERSEQRLQEVLRYAESGVCRRRQLLAHFDEQHPGNCGACDICRGEVETEDATVAAQKILSAAVRTGQRFGGRHLVDVVTGRATDRVIERGHDRLPTFGVGRDESLEYWLSIVRDVESAGLLARADGRQSGFRLTDEGRRVLKGKASFVVRRSAVAAGTPAGGGYSNRGGGSARSGGSIPSERLTPGGDPARADYSPAALGGEEALFQRLRRLRTRIARERGVPPYTIFSDKSLKVMVRNRPTDRRAFLRCSGVGEYKLEEFGEAFLREIREFLAGE